MEDRTRRSRRATSRSSSRPSRRRSRCSASSSWRRRSSRPACCRSSRATASPWATRSSAHPDIRLVSLTGDTATGKIIAKNAADTVKRVHLELGGKAPMVVLDDADPATVAEAIKIGGYFNSGQDCTASSRILVSERDLRRRALGDGRGRRIDDRGRSRRRTTRSGWGRSSPPSSRSASSASSSARPTRRPRSSRAASAVGDRGFFISPTLVTDVDQNAEIVQNEVFGPVVTMQSVASDDAAIEMANDVRYGLAASVFSENVGRAMKVAAKLDFGTVWINEHLFPLTLGDAARRLQGVRLREGHVASTRWRSTRASSTSA